MKLSKFIEKNNMTQVEFARKAGINKTYLNDTLHGRHKYISEDCAKKIKKAAPGVKVKQEKIIKYYIDID